MSEVSALVAGVHREEWGRIVATLIRITGDWGLAEECAQDAFEAALTRWPTEGIPPSPGAWLTTVAKNRAIDRLRRRANESLKLREAAMIDDLERAVDGGGDGYGREGEDDRLRLIFTCCHPALSLDARIALTLRTVAGLTTDEIAHLFLVPESTMAQRLVRAQAKIKNAGIPYRVPPDELLAERMPGVLAVLYLLFTSGYAATTGESLVRRPLTAEAIRVTTVLAMLMPAEPEVRGLLALMLLHDARSDGRTDDAGELVPLEEQDRSRWDRDVIEEGLRVLNLAPGPDAPGRYRIQARIAAAHASAPDWESTRFASIVRAYDELVALDPSPVVRFNRAVAIGMVDGPEAGLREVERLAPELDGYYLFPAARADFLRRLGRVTESQEAYRRALDLVPSDAERRYLRRRLDEVSIG